MAHMSMFHLFPKQSSASVVLMNKILLFLASFWNPLGENSGFSPTGKTRGDQPSRVTSAVVCQVSLWLRRLRSVASGGRLAVAGRPCNGKPWGKHFPRKWRSWNVNQLQLHISGKKNVDWIGSQKNVMTWNKACKLDHSGFLSPLFATVILPSPATYLSSWSSSLSFSHSLLRPMTPLSSN